MWLLAIYFIVRALICVFIGVAILVIGTVAFSIYLLMAISWGIAKLVKHEWNRWGRRRWYMWRAKLSI